MYSSVSVGVVQVLCTCAQVHSTVWCSCHTAACNHLTTHHVVAFSMLVIILLLVLLVVIIIVLLLVVLAAAVLVLATQLIFAFLWTPENRQIGGVFRIFSKPSEQKNILNTNVFCASEAQNHGSKNHGIYNVFVPRKPKTMVAKTTVFIIFLCLGSPKPW